MTASGYELDDAVRELRELLRRVDLKYARIRPASGVGFTDDGGFYGGGDLTLEDILNLIGAGTAPGAFLKVIGGGEGTVQALGTLGATETINVQNANLFWGTLDQACTIGFTGWTNLKDAQILLELIEDGTGLHLPTFSGVTWKTTAPTAAAAGEVIHVALWSRDGGTTIWGAVIGGGAASTDAMVPYLIEAGETFTVPVKKQALFNMAITVDAGGSLNVDGFLLMVT